MSVMVTVKTTMTSASTARKAFERRFNNVKVSGNSLTMGIRPAGRNWDVNVTFDLNKMEARLDSDHRGNIDALMDEAYRAEEIIQAAEDEGRLWTESRNDENELVLEIEW